MPTKTWTVYVLEDMHGYQYVGQTTNLSRRITQHRKGDQACASKHSTAKETYQAVRTYPGLSYLTARRLERVLKKHIHLVGLENIDEDDLWLDTEHARFYPSDYRISVRYNYDLTLPITRTAPVQPCVHCDRLR